MAELKTYKRTPGSINDDPPPQYKDYVNTAYLSDPHDLNGIQHHGQADTMTPPELDPSQSAGAEPAKEEGEGAGEDEEGDELGWCSGSVNRVQQAVYGFLETNSDVLWKAFYVLLLLGYIAYFIAAMVIRFGDEGSIRLLVVTALVVLYLMFRLFEYLIRRGTIVCCDTSRLTKGFGRLARKMRLYYVVTGAMLVLAVVYVAVEIARFKPKNLISLGGMATFILLFYVFSTNPAKVNWRPVIWGILLQFLFAVVILRTTWGYDAFAYLGDRVTEFLAYTDAGAKFVFGDLYLNHFFAFKVMPVVVFFSTFVSMMYYVGFMQLLIRNIGRFLSFCLDTSPAESLNAAGNIFIGQSEAPLMVRPFIQDMTCSELHAVLTGGFATIAGSVMAAYILYGVPPNHLLSASVMSAPAALAMSKLVCPETEKVKHTADDVYNMQRGTERNIIEAASNGASQSVKLVANIVVNLIAFVALLDFINATLIWFGDRIDMQPKLTFQLICSYLFYPLAFLMGVDDGDRLKIGELIGTKTFLNEFYAYTELGVYIKNRKTLTDYLFNSTQNVTASGNWYYSGDDIILEDIGETLVKGVLTDRTVVIATYALCGFSNLASMGLMLGALGGMAPSRKSDLSGLVLRAMIAGNVACFMTACIAGLLSE